MQVKAGERPTTLTVRKQRLPASGQRTSKVNRIILSVIMYRILVKGNVRQKDDNSSNCAWKKNRLLNSICGECIEKCGRRCVYVLCAVFLSIR